MLAEVKPVPIAQLFLLKSYFRVCQNPNIVQRGKKETLLRNKNEKTFEFRLFHSYEKVSPSRVHECPPSVFSYV